MNALDWGIIACYLAGMVGLALWLGRTQKTGNDYFLGGNRVGHWAIAISILATRGVSRYLSPDHEREPRPSSRNPCAI